MLGEVTGAPSDPADAAEPAWRGANDRGDSANVHQVQAVMFTQLADAFAAWAADLARTFDIANDAAKPVFTGPGAEDAERAFHGLMSGIPREANTTANRLRLVGQASAAMSFAHDELMASGGSDNPTALARYQEADRWYADLLNAERPDDDTAPWS
jgi:hypothetical protein